MAEPVTIPVSEQDIDDLIFAASTDWQASDR